MSRTLLAALAVIALVLVLILTIEKPTKPSSTTPDSPSERFERTHDAIDERFEIGQDIERAPLVVRACRLNGGVVANARVSSAPSEMRRLELSAVEDIGTTDENGELTIHTPPAHETILVDANGFVTASKPLIEADAGLLVVELQEAASLIVRATTSDGEPVANLAMALSSAGVSESELKKLSAATAETRTSGDGWASYHLGETTLDGQIEFRRLKPGLVYGTTWHQSHVLLEGWPAGGLRLTPGRNELNLVVAPLCGVFASVYGDDMTEWYIESPKGALTPFLSRMQTDSRRRSMMSSVNQGICVLQCWNTAELEMPTPVNVQILTRRRGWIQTTAQWRALDSQSVPEVIDVSTAPIRPMAEIVIALTTANGTNLDGVHLVVQQVDSKHPEFEVTSGTPFSVAPATYRVRSRNPFVQRALGARSIDMLESQTFEMQLNANLIPLRPKIADSFGNQPGSGQLTLKSGDRSITRMFGFSGPTVFWVPEGTVNITAFAPGCEPLHESLETAAPRGGSLEPSDAQQFQWTLQRRSE